MEKLVSHELLDRFSKFVALFNSLKNSLKPYDITWSITVNMNHMNKQSRRQKFVYFNDVI